MLVDAVALAFNSSGMVKEMLLYKTGSPPACAVGDGAAAVIACSVEATMVSTPGPVEVTGRAGVHAESIRSPMANTIKVFFCNYEN